MNLKLIAAAAHHPLVAGIVQENVSFEREMLNLASAANVELEGCTAAFKKWAMTRPESWRGCLNICYDRLLAHRQLPFEVK